MKVRGRLNISQELLGKVLKVQQSDGTANFVVDTLIFEADNFYLTQNQNNQAMVNFRGTAGGGTGGEANTASNLAGDEGVFAQKSGVDLQFKSLTAGTNITLSSDANTITLEAASGGGGGGGGSASQDFNNQSEWQFTHNLGTSDLLWSTFDDGNQAIIPLKVDTSNINTAYFYFTSAVTGTAVLGSGVNVTDGIKTFIGVGEINFNDNQFYLTSDADGSPVVNSKGVDSSTGNGAKSQSFNALAEWQFNHNLGSSTLLWATFDDANEAVIPLKVDASDVNTAYFYFSKVVTGTAILGTGGGPGVDIKDETNTFAAATELNFNSLQFYLTSDGDGSPVVNSKEGDELIEGLPVHIQSPTITNYILDEAAAYKYDILSVTGRVASGTASGGFYINGIKVNNMENIAFTDVQNSIGPSANFTVNEGQRLKFSVFAASTPADLAFTMKTKRS